ncbi:unnamed protein product [Mytilus edulis]|uniref:Uncharacterized protein n=1 Tax=Mytilus edulis TaxID=6550 RepID=A0A8S3T2E2_MYTED|nr:unnamed protein product [Mytilus edulis]
MGFWVCIICWIYLWSSVKLIFIKETEGTMKAVEVRVQLVRVASSLYAPTLYVDKTDEDKGDIISIPNLRILPNKNAQSTDSGNIIVGIVVPIVVMILITVVIIIIVFMFGEDADPTNARSNIIALREEHRKYETSQNENETDTNVVTHTGGNESTNDRPKLIVSGEERTNNESSKDNKEFDSRIVISDYEQLDISEQDKRTKTYDQLHFKHSVVIEHDEPTDEHYNNILPK